jgi:hypothetical protein
LAERGYGQRQIERAALQLIFEFIWARLDDFEAAAPA